MSMKFHCDIEYLLQLATTLIITKKSSRLINHNIMSRVKLSGLESPLATETPTGRQTL